MDKNAPIVPLRQEFHATKKLLQDARAKTVSKIEEMRKSREQRYYYNASELCRRIGLLSQTY